MDKSTREAHALEQRVKDIVLSLPDGSSFLRNYIIYASSLTDCNAVYHLGAGLTVLAQSVHDDLHVRLGNKLPGNIYALAIGPSTNSRKTASVAIGRELVDEALPGQATKYPGSYEGLIDALIEKGRQLLLFEEFGSLLAQAERGYMTPIKATLTGIYDGSPVSRALAKGRRKDTAIVQKPRLSIFGACTPGYLSRHSEPVDWTDGFFARFLIFRGERARRNDFPIQELPEQRGQLVAMLRERAGCPTAPPCLGIAQSAAGTWRSWCEQLDQTYLRAPKEIAGAVGRANGHVLKIAMLLAWDFGAGREGQAWTLNKVHLEPAMEIVRIHLESVFSVGEELAGTIAMNDRQSVLQAVSETPTMLGVVCRRARLLKRRVLEIIETLLEERAIEKVAMQEGNVVFEAFQRTKELERKPAEVIQMFKAVQPTPQPLVLLPPSSEEPGEG